MSKGYISKSYILKYIENPKNTRKRLKKIGSLIDRHSKNICDIFSLKTNIKCFRIISCTFARFTLDIDIWKKVHFYFFHTTSFTYFTPTSFRIKRKSSWAVSSFLCLMRSCKYFTNKSKYTSICCYIRMWGFPYRCLINDNRLVDVFQSFDSSMFSYLDSTSMKIIHNLVRQYIDNQ